jgi:hypothetical protein
VLASTLAPGVPELADRGQGDPLVGDLKAAGRDLGEKAIREADADPDDGGQSGKVMAQVGAMAIQILGEIGEQRGQVLADLGRPPIRM